MSQIRPNIHRAHAQRALALAAVASSTLTGVASAQQVADDFESHAAGVLPGAPWHDVIERVGEPTFEAPTAIVIDTTDAHGEPTKALQTVKEIGSSSGAFALLEAADVHILTVDVRIDQMPTANSGWPIGVGFAKDQGGPDINVNSHAVVYAWTDNLWRLFAGGGGPGLDLLIPTPPIVMGKWYTIRVAVDTTAAMFEVKILDAATGALLGSNTRTLGDWDLDAVQYDAVVFFDGDAGTLRAGQATLDNVTVDGPCAADAFPPPFGDQALDFFDVSWYLALFQGGSDTADVNGDGNLDFFDVSAFLGSYSGGCV